MSLLNLVYDCDLTLILSLKNGSWLSCFYYEIYNFGFSEVLTNGEGHALCVIVYFKFINYGLLYLLLNEMA